MTLPKGGRNIQGFGLTHDRYIDTFQQGLSWVVNSGRHELQPHAAGC